MAENKASASGWTEQDKIVFFLGLMETGAITIDWQKACLPTGKTRNACTKMLQRLKSVHKAEIEELTAGMATGSSAEGDPKASAPKGKKNGKAAAGKSVKNGAATKVKKAPAKRGKTASEDEADEDGEEEGDDVAPKRIKKEHF